MKTSTKKTNRRGVRSTSAKSKKNTPVSRQLSRSRSAKTKTKSPLAKSSVKPKSKTTTQQNNADLMKKLLHEILKDTLNAEKQLVKALPKMAKGATSKQLASSITKHVSETEKHIKRLEKVFAICDLKVTGKKCEAMEGMIKEGKEALDETPKGSLVRDIAIIVIAKKIEHYEMAGYSSLISIAEVCGFPKAAELLQQTLDEETMTDKKLTGLSESLNPKSSHTSASVVTTKPSAKTKSAAISKDEEKEEELEKVEAVYLDKDRDDEEEEDDDDIYDDDDEEDEAEDEEQEETTPGIGKTL